MFDVWADRWLERKGQTVRANTMAGDRSDLIHRRGAFGHYRIQDVTEEDLERLVRSMNEARTQGRRTRRVQYAYSSSASTRS